MLTPYIPSNIGIPLAIIIGVLAYLNIYRIMNLDKLPKQIRETENSTWFLLTVCLAFIAFLVISRLNTPQIVFPSLNSTETGYSLTGTGSYDSIQFPLNSNPATFNITYKGNGTFNVSLYDQNNNMIATLENVIIDGTLSNSQSVQVQAGKQYSLEIITTGYWTINIQ